MDYRDKGKKQTVRITQVFTLSVHVPLEPQVRHLSIIRLENTIHSFVAYSGCSTFGECQRGKAGSKRWRSHRCRCRRRSSFLGVVQLKSACGRKEGRKFYYPTVLLNRSVSASVLQSPGYIYTGYCMSNIPSEECDCYGTEPLLRSAAMVKPPHEYSLTASAVGW